MSPAAPAGLGHVPVLLEEAMAALDPRPGGLYVDGTFGAGGYSRALLDRGAKVDRPRSRPVGRSGWRSARRFVRRAASSLSRRASAISTRSRSVSASTRWTESCSTSAFRRCSSTRRRAASRCASTRPSICAWGAAAVRPPTSCATRTRGPSPTFCFTSARSAPRAGSRAPSSPTARQSRSPRRWSLPGSSPASRRRGAESSTHPATRAFQALRIAVNDELGELVRGLSRRRAAHQARRSPRGCDVPLARGPDRQAVPRLPLGPRASGVAPLAWRAGRSRADVRRSARPAN